MLLEAIPAISEPASEGEGRLARMADGRCCLHVVFPGKLDKFGMYVYASLQGS
jgi:hypothetical protein